MHHWQILYNETLVQIFNSHFCPKQSAEYGTGFVRRYVADLRLTW